MIREEIMAMARDANPEHDLTAMLPFLSRFAALAAAKERERITYQLISIGDGYGVRDKGLSAETYNLMQQTAYEHAAVVMTNGKQWSALSPEELAAIRARGTKEGV